MKKCIRFALMLFIIFTSSAASAVEFGDISAGNDVDIHGFISQGYMKSTHNNFFAETVDGTSEFSEVGFNLGTDVSDNLHLGIQFFARKLGEFGKGEIEIDWAYGDYRWKDWLGVRAGKMKMPHGLHNATRDIDFLRTNIFLPQSVYNEAWRDTVAAMQGGELYGDIYLGGAGSISYQFQGGNSEFPVDSGVATTTEDQTRLAYLNFEADDYFPDYSAATGIVWTTPVDGLRLSLTGWLVSFTLKGTATGRLPFQEMNGGFEMDTRSAEWTGSFEYALGNLTIAGEYSRNNYDFRAGGDVFDNMQASSGQSYSPTLNAIAAGISHVELETEGYYGSLAYRFTDWLEVGTYYSVYYADRDDKDGKENEESVRKEAGYKDHDAWLKDLCLSLRFDLSPNWVLKLEGHKMDGAAILMKQINSVNDILDTEKDWYLGAAKVTFSF
ncbi:MAG: hypothetical protein H6680_06855 [Desulfobacteraceae bacterium]|nr:hypothetical protein [Desulfobacteraceae bacterium]